MKLTEQQIQLIDNYLISCDIKWVDVRAELIDHFANSLEKKLEENPSLNFKQAIINEHKGFSDFGFKTLLKAKKKAVKRQFYNQVFTNLKSFFKLPKIIISIVLFYGLVLLMELISNKELFFVGLTVVIFLIVIQKIVRDILEKKKKNNKFLLIDRTAFGLTLYNILMILFSNLTTIRTEKSFTNTNYNYVQIGIFVLLILFYWCGEYVYFMNKKYIQKHYFKIVI